MKKIFKSCSIYRKSQGFFIFGYVRTPYGGVGREPVTKLPVSATSSQVGSTILRIFGELSGEVVDVDLASAMASFRSHLKDLGFKNVAAFERGALVVGVEFDGEFTDVISTEKDEHGANSATASRSLPPTATAEEIGRTVLGVFGDAFKAA